MTVPPGPAIFYAAAEGNDLPYTRARLAPADRGKGVAPSATAMRRPGGLIILSDCHAYRIVDVPANVETFALDLELTRGASRKGRLIDPDGKPVTDVVAYGLAANWQVKTLDDATFEAVGLEPGRRGRSRSSTRTGDWPARSSSGRARGRSKSGSSLAARPSGGWSTGTVNRSPAPWSSSRRRTTGARSFPGSTSASGPMARSSPPTRTAGSASRGSTPRWASASRSTRGRGPTSS